MEKKILFATIFWGLLLIGAVSAQTLSFDADEPQKPPKGFTTALTGKGKAGAWVVVKDETSPSKPNVLAQTDTDNTSYRFPVCIYDSLVAKDADIRVKFKPLKGKVDQGAGIVWRYQDRDNYYVVRANALEDNVVLYKVEKGKRSDLDPVGSGLFAYGKKAEVANGEWQTLRVMVKGKRFEVYLNDKNLFAVEDETFTTAGKVGLWTKADSYTYFDDLTIQVIK